MRYLTVPEVLFIHYRMIEKFGGLPGVKDVGALESAVFRPQQTAFGEDLYPAFSMKAAALLHSLALNHPFHDANKRTAITAAGVFLRLNGIALIADNQALEEFMVTVVEEHLEVEQIAEWLSVHSDVNSSLN